MANRRFYFAVKRALDIAGSALGLVCLAPLAVLIAAAVKLDSPGPVLFRQRRLGKGGASFTLYKFRTMRHNAPPVRNTDGSAYAGQDDPRLTRVGRFLRESSLDELPQLINVLRGEMTLVGPRPDLVSQLDSYDDLFRRKLLVKPGLTSLPAVTGRNSLGWRQRAELDSYYVAHLSLWLDLRILLKTVLVVFSRRGIYTTAGARGARSAEHLETIR